MTSEISVNGRDEPLSAATLGELLQQRGITGGRGVAVAINGTVIPSGVWGDRALLAGDRVEIVRPFGGG